MPPVLSLFDGLPNGQEIRNALWRVRDATLPVERRKLALEELEIERSKLMKGSPLSLYLIQQTSKYKTLLRGLNDHHG